MDTATVPGVRGRMPRVDANMSDSELNQQREKAQQDSLNEMAEAEGGETERAVGAITRQSYELEVPVVLEGKVVYLGPGSKHQAAMPGRMFEEREEQSDGSWLTTDKRASFTEGVTPYDFTMRDAAGRIIRQRIYSGPVTEAVGKPWAKCEHAEHLRHFMRSKDLAGNRLYSVIIKDKYRPVFDNYVRDRARTLRAEDDKVSETIGQV